MADPDGEMLKIKDRLKNNILPSVMGLFDVVSEKHEGKDVIKIIFASASEKPYYLKEKGMTERGAFVRVGTAVEPMPANIIENLFSRRVRNSLTAMDRQEIQERLNLANRENFRLNYLRPALDAGFVEMTIPDKPNSRLQKYRLTTLGKRLKKDL